MKHPTFPIGLLKYSSVTTVKALSIPTKEEAEKVFNQYYAKIEEYRKKNPVQPLRNKDGSYV